ncbi:MAG TPA: penicillin-binding protein 1C [Chitinophagaceae bacterium]|nr:penicillin-binding protein 1C [Chitinophagaceae bacterium]
MSKIPLKIKIFFTVAVALFTWFWFTLPSKLFNNPTCFVIEDKDGNLLNASIAADGQWRFPYDENVPDKFIQCIISFEDKRFYYHPGVDLIAFARAALKNLRSKETVQGGSTLTMQVIRLSRHETKRNLWEKVIESIRSIRLECSYSKNQIMALYASEAPFGSNVVGLDAASWRYFGRSPDKLSWGEMAALAVLPNAPALVHPGKNRDVLLKKRNALLDRLLANKILDDATCNLSKLEPLPGSPVPLPQLAPHLLQRYKEDVKVNPDFTTSRQTTIDINLQKNVSDILNEHHNVLRGNGIYNACALVLDVETGNALAYVGNINGNNDPEMESDVDVIKAPRSPGSALKPILYAAMFSDGMILPNSLIPDIPTQIGGYTPQNFDLGYDGAVPASMALSRSLNIPAVKLLQQYKYQRFYDLLKQLGMTTLNRPADNYGLSLILGGSEVTMWDLAGIYAGMARTLNHQKKNKGVALKEDFYSPGYFVDDKEIEKTSSQDAINSLDATSIWFAFQAMEEVMRPGEEGLWQEFSSSQRIAWKTGTSFGFRDAWAIGITSKYVVAVWTGNTDGEGRAGLIGVQTSAPIMFDIFRELPSSQWFSKPQNNFSFIPVCGQSGYRANIDCPNPDTIMVSKSGYRGPLCPYHKLIHLDATGTYRVDESCESPANMIHQSWFVLTPAIEWYYKQKNHDYKPLPPFKAGCKLTGNGRQMELIYPLQDAKIYVPLEIDGSRGKTVFTAAHRKRGSKIFWHLDDEFIGTTINFHEMALSPAPGKHLLTIVDENGESVSREFEILEKGR